MSDRQFVSPPGSAEPDRVTPPLRGRSKLAASVARPSGRAVQEGLERRTRAGNQEGRIYQLPSGSYAMQLRLGKGKDGKRLRVHLSGKTKAEVKRKRDELVVRHRQGILADPAAGKQTTGTFMAAWLECKRGTVEPSTWARYRLAVERHLRPVLGRVSLAQLDADAVRAAYAALQAPPFSLAAQSVRQAHSALYQALTQAVRDGKLPRNAAEYVKLPKLPKPGVRALVPDEVARLVATSAGDWRTLWLVALHTGLRLGELLALSWADVTWQGRDEGGGAIRVARAQATDEDQRPFLRPYPKSSSGVRVVPVGSELVAQLRAHLAQQSHERAVALRWEDTEGADGLVFVSRFGTMLLKSNVVRAFKRDAAEAQIAGIVSPHLLRHTFASSLLAAGRPVPEVAYLLGHGSPAVTMRIYAHVVPGAGEGAATVLSRFYATGDGQLRTGTVDNGADPRANGK